MGYSTLDQRTLWESEIDDFGVKTMLRSIIATLLISLGPTLPAWGEMQEIEVPGRLHHFLEYHNGFFAEGQGSRAGQLVRSLDSIDWINDGDPERLLELFLEGETFKITTIKKGERVSVEIDATLHPTVIEMFEEALESRRIASGE